MKSTICAGCGMETSDFTCVNPKLEESGHPYHLDLCPVCIQKFEQIEASREVEIKSVNEKYNRKLIDSFNFNQHK